MNGLVIGLLGPYEARTTSGREVPFQTSKSRALLAVLARTPGRFHTRERLAALLWPTSGEAEARNSLRNELSILRRAIADTDAHLIAADEHVALSPEGVEVDVTRFESLHREVSRDALIQATRMIRGVFMEGFDLRAEPFRDWLEAERAALREQTLSTTRRLIECYLAAGDAAPGILLALNVLERDPFDEAAHAALMRSYHMQGRLGAALEHYGRYAELARRELGAEPGPDLRRVRTSLLESRPTAATEPEPRALDAGTVVETGAVAASAGPNSIVSPSKCDGPEPDPLGMTNMVVNPIRGALARDRWPVMAGAALALALASGVSWWNFGTPTLDPVSPASTAFRLLEKPSVAVLPFDNLTGDTAQKHIADGMTEALTSTLSKIPDLFVFARNSAASYDGKAVEVRQVAEELGVR